MFGLKAAVSIALLGLLLSRLGAAAVLEVIGGANKLLLAAGGLCLIVQTAISALKWRVLLAGQGQHVGYLPLFTTYLIGNFINLFMPSVAGGDAYRAVWLRKHTKTISAALPSIVVERATGLAALIALAVVGLALLQAPDRAAYVVGAAAMAALGAYAVLVYPVAEWVWRQPRERFFKLTGIAGDVLRSSRLSVAFVAVVVLSFVFQFNTVLINWLYASSMDLSVTFLQLLIIVPVVYLVEMIPISLNGVGVREGTFAVLFAQMGLPPEQGVALGLTITLMRYVVGLIGGSLFTVSMLRRPAVAGSPS
ncbi:MAG: flippase-like domain-containing protein [Gammaproteobacteria bacterium]|nr:flippase-like domain-containing protein [Gammaproteobacteria bacterium]